MPEHVSFLQLLGATVLAVAAVLWVIGLTRVLRSVRAEQPSRHSRPVLSALPHQRQAAPELEAVELTPAERDAFAGLVRQLNDGR
ncbi:hypothetical protein ACIBU0_19540 [Streptomyces sp. NPDC049627]|uniref:hypothetical protein n=1 Tax=Streptomyces sp. NPDC049627 TaxID=3365595 RepID=UPI0037AD3D42